jgi:xanthine/CO dehydrogenase XdhC/CoxF family maturation factor
MVDDGRVLYPSATRMERRETAELLRAYDDARREGRRSALATVVRVRGSAYRREGARMLVRDDGAITCMLSGGCLEPEVAEVARRVLDTGRAELRHYDLDEAAVWGLGLGCGGTVDVYIEPVGDASLSGEWLEVLRRGEAAVLVSRLDGSARRLLVPRDDTGGAPRSADAPQHGLDALDRQAVAIARGLLRQTHPRSVTQTLQGPDGAVDVFFDVSGPPPELVIFGAGHDAIPLAAQVRDLGWPVTIVDARAAFTTPDRFPGARLVLAHPSQFSGSVALGERSHVMVMNHHLERDRLTLAYVLESDAPWVGVLGPRARYQKLLDGLAADGIVLPADALARIRNPVGLDIGAESAEEVALSIVGALVAERRGFGGGSLDGVTGRIHDPRR